MGTGKGTMVGTGTGMMVGMGTGTVVEAMGMRPGMGTGMVAAVGDGDSATNGDADVNGTVMMMIPPMAKRKVDATRPPKQGRPP